MAFSILIVDDSLPMRSVIKKTFKAAGYGTSEFHEAANGREALEKLRQNWIDLVVTDFTMPEMNGLELIRAMRADDLFSETPVVVVTTEGSREKVDEFMKSGASGYLKKPFTPEKLRDIIVRMLGESDDQGVDDDDDDLDF